MLPFTRSDAINPHKTAPALVRCFVMNTNEKRKVILALDLFHIANVWGRCVSTQLSRGPFFTVLPLLLSPISSTSPGFGNSPGSCPQSHEDVFQEIWQSNPKRLFRWFFFRTQLVIAWQYFGTLNLCLTFGKPCESCFPTADVSDPESSQLRVFSTLALEFFVWKPTKGGTLHGWWNENPSTAKKKQKASQKALAALSWPLAPMFSKYLWTHHSRNTAHWKKSIGTYLGCTCFLFSTCHWNFSTCCKPWKANAQRRASWRTWSARLTAQTRGFWWSTSTSCHNDLGFFQKSWGGCSNMVAVPYSSL